MTVSLTEGPFRYNRFTGQKETDSLVDAYMAMYEEKCDDKEDGVSKKEKKAIKDEVKDHKDKEHDDDKDDKDEKGKPPWLKKEEVEIEEAIDAKYAKRADAAKGKKKESQDEINKRLMLGKHSPANKFKKEEVTIETVVEYLMDEGYANNPVSAEVMIEHMSEDWQNHIVDEIREGYVDFNKGKLRSGSTPREKTLDSMDRKMWSGPDTRNPEKTSQKAGKQYNVLSDKSRSANKKA